MKLRIKVKPAGKFQKVSREDLEDLADSLRLSNLINLSNPEGIYIGEESKHNSIIFSERLFPEVRVYPKMPHGYIKIEGQSINPSDVYSHITDKGYNILDSRISSFDTEHFSKVDYSLLNKPVKGDSQ